MAELFLELLSEEIPARMQARASDDFKRLVCDGLKAAGLAFTDAKAFVTPRRIALVVDGLPALFQGVLREHSQHRIHGGLLEDAVRQSVGAALDDARRGCGC